MISRRSFLLGIGISNGREELPDCLGPRYRLPQRTLVQTCDRQMSPPRTHPESSRAVSAVTRTRPE
jgi:hypothetical protein